MIAPRIVDQRYRVDPGVDGTGLFGEPIDLAGVAVLMLRDGASVGFAVEEPGRVVQAFVPSDPQAQDVRDALLGVVAPSLTGGSVTTTSLPAEVLPTWSTLAAIASVAEARVAAPHVPDGAWAAELVGLGEGLDPRLGTADWLRGEAEAAAVYLRAVAPRLPAGGAAALLAQEQFEAVARVLHLPVRDLVGPLGARPSRVSAPQRSGASRRLAGLVAGPWLVAPTFADADADERSTSWYPLVGRVEGIEPLGAITVQWDARDHRLDVSVPLQAGEEVTGGSPLFARLTGPSGLRAVGPMTRRDGRAGSMLTMAVPPGEFEWIEVVTDLGAPRPADSPARGRAVHTCRLAVVHGDAGDVATAARLWESAAGQYFSLSDPARAERATRLAVAARTELGDEPGAARLLRRAGLGAAGGSPITAAAPRHDAVVLFEGDPGGGLQV